jgi:hypothetical protein
MTESGFSTGPHTPAGLARSQHADWKHWQYSAQAKTANREAVSCCAWQRVTSTDERNEPVRQSGLPRLLALLEAASRTSIVRAMSWALEAAISSGS